MTNTTLWNISKIFQLRKKTHNEKNVKISFLIFNLLTLRIEPTEKSAPPPVSISYAELFGDEVYFQDITSTRS